MIKGQKGYTGIDITISIIIITVFIAVIANLITNINLNSKNIERKSVATSYAIQEIENIKAQGYTQYYEGKGIEEEFVEENDILDSDNNFSGYHKKITIKDYSLIQKNINNDNSKISNLVKEVTVEISYSLGNNENNVIISTYITKE